MYDFFLPCDAVLLQVVLPRHSLRLFYASGGLPSSSSRGHFFRAVRGSIWVPVGSFFWLFHSGAPAAPESIGRTYPPVAGIISLSPNLRCIYAYSTPKSRLNFGIFRGCHFWIFRDPNTPKSRERRGDLFVKHFFRLMSFLSTPQSTPILRLIYAYSTPRCGRPLLYATIYAYSTPNLRLIYASGIPILVPSTVWQQRSMLHQ